MNDSSNLSDAMEDALKRRANLQHTEPTLREVAGATKGAVHRLRLALGAAGLVKSTAGAMRGLGMGRRRRKIMYDSEANGA